MLRHLSHDRYYPMPTKRNLSEGILDANPKAQPEEIEEAHVVPDTFSLAANAAELLEESDDSDASDAESSEDEMEWE